MNIQEAVQTHLRCIDCGDHFTTTVDDATGMGIIRCCHCPATFPLIRHVPRLLRGKLLENCYYYYADDIQRHPELKDFFAHQQYQYQGSRHEKIIVRTQKQFGYEWHKWSHLPQYAEDHFFYVTQKSPQFFSGKTGWDPAVGKGRDIFLAAQAVGNNGFMIGSDVSFAVDVAYERCRQLTNVLIVQADLYDNFLDDSSLDFSYMIGLIQHLSQPRLGIERVYRKVRQGGHFFGTIYTSATDLLSGLLVGFIYGMRLITVHLPFSVVYVMSWLCAVPAYLFFKLPPKILKKFRYVQSMNELYPQQQTQQGQPNLDLLTHTWFDHFTPPVIGFYSEKEITDLLAGIPLKNFTLRVGIFSGDKV